MMEVVKAVSIPIGTRIPPHIGRQSFQQVAAFARETGLTAIDLPAITEERVTVCRDFGLQIGTVDVQGVGQLLNPSDDVRTTAVSNIQGQIEAAAHLGAKVIFMCLVPEDNSQSIRASLGYFEETFSTIAKVCEDCGVKIALEGWPGPGPHYATLGYTPEVWRAMFAAVPSEALGLCFDPSHLIRLGINPMRVLAEFRHRIYHCHGKDTQLLPEAQYLYGHLSAKLDKAPDFSEGPWRYCIPGEGESDWRRIAYELQAADYAGCISVELEDARYWGSLELEQQGIRKAFAHLSANVR